MIGQASTAGGGRKPRLLVTGASGFLGWTLARQARETYEVHGQSCRHALPEGHGITSWRAELGEEREILDLFRAVRPDAVVHLAAMADPNTCQRDPTGSGRVNLHPPRVLADLCAAAAIPYAFASTDLVFDGRRGAYREGDAPNPVNLYGEQKARAEEAVLAAWPKALVARLPLMYGRPGPFSASFVRFILEGLREGRTVRLFTDEMRSLACAGCVAGGLLRFLGSASGRLHLGGREVVSRYDFGGLVAGIMGADRALLAPVLQKDLPMAAARPRDVSLDSAKAWQAGYAPKPLAEALRESLAAEGGATA